MRLLAITMSIASISLQSIKSSVSWHSYDTLSFLHKVCEHRGPTPQEVCSPSGYKNLVLEGRQTETALSVSCSIYHRFVCCFLVCQQTYTTVLTVPQKQMFRWGLVLSLSCGVRLLFPHCATISKWLKTWKKMVSISAEGWKKDMPSHCFPEGSLTV